jgi:hypothetical protein
MLTAKQKRLSPQVWRAATVRWKKGQHDYPDPGSGFLLPFLADGTEIIDESPHVRCSKGITKEAICQYLSHINFIIGE